MSALGRFSGVMQRLQRLSDSRIGKYFAAIYNDYRTVFFETVQDARDHPVKATAYLSTLAVCTYFVKKNPTETDFYSQLTNSANDLATVGEPVRNRVSNSHIQYLNNCHNAGVLRRFTFGLFSIMWTDNFDGAVDLYEARCKVLKVGWLEWHHRIVDIGVLGRWLWLERAMIDYDINPDEWTGLQRDS